MQAHVFGRSNSQYGRGPRKRRARRSRPENTAKRGDYEVGRALRARRCKRDRPYCELLIRSGDGQVAGGWAYQRLSEEKCVARASREELWLGTPQTPLTLLTHASCSCGAPAADRTRRDAASTPSGLYRSLGQSPGGSYALLPTPHSLNRRRDGMAQNERE